MAEAELVRQLNNPPPGIDLAESRQANLYACFITSYSLAVLSVGLRLLCRKNLTKVGFWYDDYAIFLSLAFATGQFIAMLVWIDVGLVKHIYSYGLSGYEDFFKTLFGIEFMYGLSIAFTKFSLLGFYWRLFGKFNMRIPVTILGISTACWIIAHIVVLVLQCQPIAGFWDKSINSKCRVNVSSFFIGESVPNILTDVVLLLLPVPYIWKLQRSWGQRIALIGVFFLGASVSVISAARLGIMAAAYKIPSVDQSWMFIGPAQLTAVEVNIGIVSACLPSLWPFILRITRAIGLSPSPYVSSSESKKHHPTVSWRRRENIRFKRFGNNVDSVLGSDPEFAAINVTTSITVQEDSRSVKNISNVTKHP